MNKKISSRMERPRKFLMVLPLIAVPFLCIAFYAMGGGSNAGVGQKLAGGTGFNMELPPVVIDRKEDKMDKLAFYARADADSARRKELLQMDPYHRKDKLSAGLLSEHPKTDTQADALLRRLDILKRQVDKPHVKPVEVKRRIRLEPEKQERFILPASHPKDTVAADPELDKLNEMLDKIARLKEGEHGEGAQRAQGVTVTKEAPAKKEVGMDREVSLGIPATVENDQELMNGAVLSMRLTSAIIYNGITIPRGQLVYGMVSMSGDRLQVNIHSIRCGSAIITTYWQVYDMDGLQGIRIPDGLGRQVARQSADQSVGGLNLMTYDPSLGGQAAGAGIQVAKSFLGRKIRTLRVMVPAGYQVFLRDTRMGRGEVRLLSDTVMSHVQDPLESTEKKIVAPSVDSLQPYMHITAKEGKVKLILKGIYLRDSLLWFYMTLRDGSPIGFVPDHVRCSIRQDRHWKRMAMQEVPLEPVYDRLPSDVVAGERTIMIGLKPFVVAKDKALVVEVGEGIGGRVLELSLHSKLFGEVNGNR